MSTRSKKSTSRKNFQARIIENRQINRHFRLLGVTVSAEIRVPDPGQFYMIQAGHSYDPLLKRPFSIFSYTPPHPPLATWGSRGGYSLLQFLYRIRGRGTSSLSMLAEGDTVQVIGPLGNGYPPPEGGFIAAAGGIGMASLLPLLEKFRNRAYLFYGAKDRDELVLLERVKAASKEAIITTDDGSEGRKGLVTEAVKDFLDSAPVARGPLPVYACGPAPMLRELSRIAAERGIHGYASLEEHMACGVGACLGCVVKTASGQKRICKEGPVFAMKDILWE